MEQQVGHIQHEGTNETVYFLESADVSKATIMPVEVVDTALLQSINKKLDTLINFQTKGTNEC